jgi:hypothetical protein
MDAMITRDRTGYRTRPTETAEVFLTRPEDARDLMRIGSLRGTQESIADASRTWLFDQLARTGVARSGAIDPGKLARWRNINGELLDTIPGLRSEIDGMVDRAQRGAALTQQAQAKLRIAEANLADTDRAITRGPLGAVAGKSPDRAVASIFASGNPQAGMRELVGTVGRNKEAAQGLKAAVADPFVDQVTRTRPGTVSEGSQAVDFASFVRRFNANEKVLSEVFTGDEMNALRRAHKLLEPLTRRAGDRSAGTVQATGSGAPLKLLEIALKGYYGILKGGGVFRTLKIAGSLSPTSAANVDRLVARMMFDPELASHLLTRNTQDVGSPAWNSQLQKLVRRTEAVRELNRDGEPEE